MVVDDLEMCHGDLASSIYESPISSSRCCFCLPCFNSRHSSSSFGGAGLAWWERLRSSSTVRAHDDPWWSRGVTAFKKIRERSEIVAGPKWKNFIRRFNRNRGSGNARHGRFQYDPLSYALNFDEGHGQNSEPNEEDDHGGYRNFSSRYASVSASVKPLAMDASGNQEVALIA